MSEKRLELIKKARSFHVPGHGPDFENMTNDQIEKHIELIEGTFRMAFDEEEEDDEETIKGVTDYLEEFKD
ncbi:hypothetical protein MOE57_07810 [Bacillus inaquosorum]|uniref:hypothetical protein n=1 Tax=Bacillus inaquosorum TaxID=483913 RepID=UPI0022825B72|nr:hypothetical protein [Bacillus inaquosorum]MCY9082388.1 hypothetical protein [Bacillus inaquosorum]